MEYDTEPYGIDDEYISTSDLNEIIYYEKLDADREQAQFEAESNRYARKVLKAETLIGEGKIVEATQICPHGHVGKLDGSCSENDPRYMQEGWRCFECGAVVDEIMGKVIHVR